MRFYNKLFPILGISLFFIATTSNFAADTQHKGKIKTNTREDELVSGEDIANSRYVYCSRGEGADKIEFRVDSKQKKYSFVSKDVTLTDVDLFDYGDNPEDEESSNSFAFVPEESMTNYEESLQKVEKNGYQEIADLYNKVGAAFESYTGFKVSKEIERMRLHVATWHAIKENSEPTYKMVISYTSDNGETYKSISFDTKKECSYSKVEASSQ